MPEWLAEIGDLNRYAQIATICGFLLALITAILVLVGKFFSVLRGLLSGIFWVARGFKRRQPEPIRVVLEQPAVPLPVLQPKFRPGPINLPAGRPVVGREAEVAELRRKLLASTEGNVSVTNSGAVLRGQGGLGKSTLARRYAELHGGDYNGVVWVEALNRQAIIEGLVALCAHVEQPVPDVPQLQHAQAVLAGIARSGQAWLFIYDNVEDYADLKGLLPPPGTHLIVTTRQGAGWPGFAVMLLDRLSFEAEGSPAVRLLMQEAGREDGASEARALAEDLGGLPLALVVAGRLIQATGEGFGAYRARLDDILRQAPQNEDYRTSAMGAVQLSYDRLSGDARMVADLCAWWAPDGLEPRLLTDAPQGWLWDRWLQDIAVPVQLLAADAGRVRAGFAELASRSLLDGRSGSWSMHLMTATSLRHLQSELGDSETAMAASALLAAVYPGGRDGPHQPSTWPLFARLTPHVRAILAAGAAPATEAMDFLHNQSAVYLDKIADYPGGLEMARASLVLKQQLLPENHRDIAVGFANLGVALMRTGQMPEAEVNLRRAVVLDEMHRPGSLDLADHYEMHGGALFRLAEAGERGAFGKAVKRNQQALILYRRLAGRNSWQTAQSLHSLAFLRNRQGRKIVAGLLADAALRIGREALDAGDARLGPLLVNLGSIWLLSGYPDRALPLLRDALQLWQNVFAAHPQHPNTRDTASWLIPCLVALGLAGDRTADLRAEARALCERYGFDFADMEEIAKQYV
ncbi:NB-ARC domain-containing protein [Hoeflea marina]|uniref:NB-ARC domain-containing protein n=1 Tax=Hoeflea marina TaxID=274592 RepID=A0A317PFV2_9HYPH|nr:tetratricopeptide repeat protein [Hoeflea marina]PWV98935.1 NB-ARC domain-containing protein [Hoeflea marina]